MTNSRTLNEEMITALNFKLVEEDEIVQGRGNGRGEGTIMTIWKIMRYKKETILDRTKSLERNVVVHEVRDSKKSVNN